MYGYMLERWRKGSRMIPGHAYPHFEVKLWGGRLPVPPELRRTPVAKLFASGALGGKRIESHERFKNTAAERARLVDWARRHRGDQFEIEYILGPQHHRHRIQEYFVFQPGFIEHGLTGHPHLPPHDAIASP